MSLTHLFEKNKILESWHNWLLSNSSWLLNWKGPGTYPQSSNCSKASLKLLPLFISIIWPSLVTKWVVVQKICSNIHSVSCTNIHHAVTDLVNHGMVENIKTWISWQRYITSLRNKKLLTCASDDTFSEVIVL